MPSGLRTVDFEFDLPPGLIAQKPAAARDQSRLLVATRAAQSLEHKRFPDLLEYLRAGDLLVLNDSRVIPARLRGINLATRGHFEILLLEETSANQWWAMLRPGRRAKPGTRIELLGPNGAPTGIIATVEEFNGEGHRRLLFTGVNNIWSELDRLGEVPLPPYIRREAGHPAAASEDGERYQTVYARAPGSVAAPTAGLHFTGPLLAQIRARGVKTCFITLHVGAGTFAPVKTDSIADHRMHEERFVVGEEAARLIAEAKATRQRVIAAGTTSLRVLESAALRHPGGIAPGRGTTDIFIYPPYDFKMIDALLTNFHLPCSTLLMLVSAFAAPGEIRGREFILRAYREAIAQNYRFFSYGDAMLLL